MPSLSLIHTRRIIEEGATFTTGPRNTEITVEFDQLWAAENTVKKFHHAIGLTCCAVIRDYYANGPKGPALLVLVATNGEGWGRGVYLCMVEDADTEPMFFLDDGESFAHLETICQVPDAKQWKYPWPKHQQFPTAIDHAEKAVLNLLGNQ